MFLSEKTFDSLEKNNIHKLKKKAREGKLFSIERDKGLRIFYLEHGADIPKRIKYFARRCFEDGFVLLVPFPENASPSPKQVFDSIKKDYEKKDGQKRNANAGQLSRWLHSTIIRLEE